MNKRQASPKKTATQPDRYTLAEWCERHGDPDPPPPTHDREDVAYWDARHAYERAITVVARNDREVRDASARVHAARAALKDAHASEEAHSDRLTTAQHASLAEQDQAEFDWAKSLRRLGEAELQHRLAKADRYDALVRSRQRARTLIDPGLVVAYERESARMRRETAAEDARRDRWISALGSVRQDSKTAAVMAAVLSAAVDVRPRTQGPCLFVCSVAPGSVVP